MTQEREEGENQATIRRMVLPEELYRIVIEAATAVNEAGLEKITCLETKSLDGRDLDEDDQPVEPGLRVFTYQAPDSTPIFDRVVAQALKVRKIGIDVYTLHLTNEAEASGQNVSPEDIAAQAQRHAEESAINSIQLEITGFIPPTQ